MCQSSDSWRLNLSASQARVNPLQHRVNQPETVSIVCWRKFFSGSAIPPPAAAAANSPMLTVWYHPFARATRSRHHARSTPDEPPLAAQFHSIRVASL
jgi:hypothetical protein